MKNSDSNFMNYFLAILSLFAIPLCKADEPLDYGRDVRPILSDRCFACHGQDANKREGGLRLDQRDGALKGGDSGSALVPGDPDASEIILRILSEDRTEMMPPPKAKKPLTAEQKEILVRWVKEGAVYTNHWSFEPIKSQQPPQVTAKNWPHTPVDRFVLAQLENKKIQPAPEAERKAFLRRVTLDLTGLPPTIAETKAFLEDRSADAHAKVVDRLLQSADYAERMAAVWLDNARYADSNGYQFDNQRTMWPWRDWVIEAFRQNMPYDRFVTEQLAGDLLENPTQQQLIATGFNRNHGYSIEGGINDEEYRVMYTNDKTATAGTLFLGLTMDCCRCHDHKYDPLSIQEYYSLYAFFNTSAEVGAPGEKGRKEMAAAPFVKVGDDSATATRAMIMAEKPRATFVLQKGLFDQPGEKVEPRTPRMLPPFEGYPQNRLGLAKWLTAQENPLFARVTVNRIWQQFFGIGLVKTADNFGLQGEMPSHPELLDWLAEDFRKSGWDMHHLIRNIVLSSTYRQDSRFRSELDDAENRLLARGPSFRLPAETIRDQALAASGLLTRKVGGPSVRPYQPVGVWEDLSAPPSHAETYQVSSGADLYRKSLYTYWRRAAIHPAMAVFDAPNREICTVERSNTNTPLQALVTLNDPTFIEAARKLAERVLQQEAVDQEKQIGLAVEILLVRTAEAKELIALKEVYLERLSQYQADPASADKLLGIGASPIDASLERIRLAAITDVCHVILNLSETLTRK
ncbi:MAG: hypothetical protein RI957_2267 [Verrucomicrobiota bacterium]|jgi:hypothetical protein